MCTILGLAQTVQASWNNNLAQIEVMRRAPKKWSCTGYSIRITRWWSGMSKPCALFLPLLLEDNKLTFKQCDDENGAPNDQPVIALAL